MVSMKMFNIGQTPASYPEVSFAHKGRREGENGPCASSASQLRFALASMRNNVRNHVKKAAPEWEAGSNPALRTPLRTLHPYTQFPLYLGKVSPYIFSTRLIRTLFVAPKVSVKRLTRIDCILIGKVH